MLCWPKWLVTWIFFLNPICNSWSSMCTRRKEQSCSNYVQKLLQALSSFVSGGHLAYADTLREFVCIAASELYITAVATVCLANSMQVFSRKTLYVNVWPSCPNKTCTFSAKDLHVALKSHFGHGLWLLDFRKLLCVA